jgi:mRNA interferase MazF
MSVNPKRGEIWLVNLDPTIGQEIKKCRPAVVISSDFYSPIPLRIIVPITKWQAKFINRPFMVRIAQDVVNGLAQDSAGNILQIRSVSTQRFVNRIGTVSDEVMKELLAGLVISVDYPSNC